MPCSRHDPTIMLRYRSSTIHITQDDMEDLHMRFPGAPHLKMKRRLSRPWSSSRQPQVHVEEPHYHPGPEHRARDGITLTTHAARAPTNAEEIMGRSLETLPLIPGLSPLPEGPQENDIVMEPQEQQPDQLQSEDASHTDHSETLYVHSSTDLHAGTVLPPRIDTAQIIGEPGHSHSFPSLARRTSPGVSFRSRDRSLSCVIPHGRNTVSRFEIVDPQPSPRSRPSRPDILQASPLDRLVDHLRSLPTTPSSGNSSRSHCSSSATSQHRLLLSGRAFTDHSYTSPALISKGQPEPNGYPMTSSPQLMTGRTPHRTSSRMSQNPEHHDEIRRTSLVRHMPSIASPIRTLPGNTSQYGTPRHPQIAKTPMRGMQPSAVRSGRNHRMKIYDDDLPAVFQPQTPAELRSRHATVPSLRARTGHDSLMSSEEINLHPAVIPPGESRYPVINDLRAPATVSRRTAPRVTDLATEDHARRAASLQYNLQHDQENDSDAFDSELEFERQIWMDSRAGVTRDATLNQTPPQEGRFERVVR
ncbi:hypothetical protein K461DRAFT_43190 [Myriangium duriaei CBS 260.36]|uniref:Uncharacterized protein n=1 Tax=Myriangium duriaei CBS 260.36 TaxID=1168546 RepID=A0A9P4MCX1_9PEZI|nr:hypothetical protein K461DRAFT_43190 [Myriangium duriaei CBS 260.36]